MSIIIIIAVCHIHMFTHVHIQDSTHSYIATHSPIQTTRHTHYSYIVVINTWWFYFQDCKNAALFIKIIMIDIILFLS